MAKKDTPDKPKKPAAPAASQPIWMDQPEDHDYPAAGAYLALLLADDKIPPVLDALRAASVSHQKAKDILRAAGLPLLGVENPHVATDLAKVKNGRALSPVLLVRGNLHAGHQLQIGDGYHRVCASYHLDENTDIPVKLADLPAN